jgi:hypothetical protein
MVALATRGSRVCKSLAATPAFHRHRAAVAAASGRFDDQLRAGPVDVCCALQQVGTVDAEPVQSGLDRAGVLTRVACGDWSRCGRVLGASGGLAAGMCLRPRRPSARDLGGARAAGLGFYVIICGRWLPPSAFSRE